MILDLTSENSNESEEIMDPIRKPIKRVGIVGGGQLGKMLAVAGSQYGLDVKVYAEDPSSCAFDVASECFCAKYIPNDKEAREKLTKRDLGTFWQFIDGCDVITTEWENIPLATIDEITRVSDGSIPFYPGREALRVAQDRLLEKKMAQQLGIPTPRFWNVEVDDMPTDVVYPVILKWRQGGYDGKGQKRVGSQEELLEQFNLWENRPCIAEEIILFLDEVSAITTRGIDGVKATFDPFTNIHKDGILSETHWPARLSHGNPTTPGAIVEKIADHLGVVGLLAVELFRTIHDDFVFNEIAPRPHNSGHLTIECASVSQFEQHMRAITGLPLCTPRRVVNGRMVNMIGDLSHLEWALKNPNARIHIYGKENVPKRKVGHITVLDRPCCMTETD
jgi:5-(carboxyamino)imidazole ribonucleotide synthase